MFAVGFAVHLPPAFAAEGGPCAGYSGCDIELALARSIGMEQPTYTQARTSRRPVG